MKPSKEDSDSIRDAKQVEVVQGIIGSILDEFGIGRVLYEGARDAISSGFSAFHLTTEYKNPYSMDQAIRLEIENLYHPYTDNTFYGTCYIPKDKK